MIAVSHPEKVLFPDDGISKGELVAYYETVAPFMLPHIVNRPVTMERFHRGIAEKGFFQKSVTKGFPEWLQRIEVPKHGGTVHHPLVTDTRSLLWMANQNCITLHVWATRVPALYHPDVCVFDLDPADDDRKRLHQAALRLRDLLMELGLTSAIKTSGSKGYHILVPLDGKSDVGAVSHFAHVVAAVMVKRDPDNLTLEFSKADRGGRIYMDSGRNHPPATYAAPYTVRAKRGAPVSAPCTWAEVEGDQVHPQAFTLRSLAARLDRVGDLWSDLEAQSLLEAIRRVREISP